MQNTTSAAKKTTTLLAGAALSIGLIGGVAAPAVAAEAHAPQAQQASQADVSKAQENIKKVDDSNLAFRLTPGDKLAQDGSAVIAKDGTKQALPSEATDKNGKAVDLRYAEKDGVVTVNVLQKGAASGGGETATQPGMATAALSDGWKCALGTGGGAGTGAIAGGAAGATIGSVVPGAGTAAGWAIGTAIGGAVSGGAVGAAASC